MLDACETIVTVFGGTGFVGRYVCEVLLKVGVRLRVAARDPREAYFLQPLGEVGQFGAVRANLGDPQAVARAVAGASAVINLTGSFRGMEEVHARGPETIARAARAAGTSALVHVSAIGADATSDCDYGRTKGEGEILVRAAFPEATIIRPSLVFGPEDALTNRFANLARLAVVPVLAPRTRFQPVYVRDLAQAIATAALQPGRHAGKTYEIGGPEVMTMAELNRQVAALSGLEPDFVPLPDVAGTVMSAFGFLPGAPLTRDQWKMLQRDNVAVPGAPGLAEFGIQPTPLGAVAEEWLGRYHGGSRFQWRRSDRPSAA